MSSTSRLQSVRSKSPAAPRSGVCDRGASPEGGLYVHTSIATSRHLSPQIFEGSTAEAVEIKRNRLRNKMLVRLYYSLCKLGRNQEAKALLGCGRWFQTIRFPCDTVKLLPIRCNSVFCPECASRRSKPLQERILRRVDQSKYHYFFLTLTVRNWKQLTREGLDGLIRQFAKLRRENGWKKEVAGGVYSLESTFNSETAEWHPHIHVLLECRRRLPKDWLGNLKGSWKRITGSHVIRLERMYGVDSRGCRRRRINRSALKELVKYATKAAPFATEPERVEEFLTAFENVRRMQSFGSFKGEVSRAEKDADETPKRFELAGCKCGMCTWGMGQIGPKVHITQTVLVFDGTRQLRLLDSGCDPPPNLEARQPHLAEEQYGGATNWLQPMLFQGPLFDGAYQQFN